MCESRKPALLCPPSGADWSGRGRGGLVRAVATAAAVSLSVLLSVLPGRAEGRALDGCRPLRAVFYAATGSLSLAQALAADPSPCAQYFVSVPPLAADKTQDRKSTRLNSSHLGISYAVFCLK